MSSTPNVTISLNPTGANASQTGDQTKASAGLPSKSDRSEFAQLVNKAREAEATDGGNGLPTEKGVRDNESAVMPKTIDVNLNDLVVRREGRLKLITGEIPISEESLVEFMREQGFSRAEMAEVLMARQDPATQIAGEQPLLTGNLLQIQGMNQAFTKANAEAVNSTSLNTSLPTEASTNKAPINLADAMAGQLMTPKAAKHIEFMQEQGFSRAEVAEILIARQDRATQISGEHPILTGNWLQIQAMNQALTEANAEAVNRTSLSASLPTEAPSNLAEALAAQLMTPKVDKQTSPIVDLIVTRDVLAGLMRTTEDSKTESSTATGVKTLDLSTLLARVESGQSGLGGQSAGQDAHSGFERGERMMAESQSASQKPQEFREFLAEHLRKADSLKDLSDRLGTILARQMNAHIARGTWRLEMALHPAELGSIEVDMEMTERGLEASFRASQTVTRDLLMESMARLKSWFEEGGIDVAYAGLTQDSDAQTGGNSTSDESSEETERRETGEVSETESSGGAVVDPHRLDIRV